MQERKFLIDFDSTFVKDETLSIMAEVALENNKDKEDAINRINTLTNQSMNGALDYGDSLLDRMSLLKFHKNMLAEVINHIKNNISDSFLQHKEFLGNKNIYILSGGFKEIITPVVKDFGIPESRVFANTLEYTADGYVVGVDKNNPLSKHSGKIDVVKQLNLSGEIIMLGDGHNDLVLKENKVVDKFYAFTENIYRKNIVSNSDGQIHNLGELISKYSEVESKGSVVLLENIHAKTVELFSNKNYTVKEYTRSLTEDELIEALQGVYVLGIRSKTKITRKVIESCTDLKVVGAFCIGVNQIDLEACSQHGITVINAPYSNTRSVVELAMGEIVMLMRGVFTKSMDLHNNCWHKSSDNSHELRGKTLGIIGYGNIGSQLSVLAESFGMNVLFYDKKIKLPLGNAKTLSSMDELLKTADVVSLHVDGDPMNNNLIGAKEFQLMKQGALLLNLSRGDVVDIKALKSALESKKIIGAAVDVYPKEPKSSKSEFSCCLQGIDNVILTPHVGGSTLEAQENIGTFVGDIILEYLELGNTELSLTLPNLKSQDVKGVYRILHIHRNTPGKLLEINKILLELGLNIEGQYLKTNTELGYVLTDVANAISNNTINKLKSITDTIRVSIIDIK
ncbi:MAG: phosphoglycerate dehydrogenase [Francisellaceae bacterium]|jgi:D-3-phosphoglycerate dehydrogenase / 2-oxoglutarate reductase|nr:phosphoglycerate dehydrogenase [Francisellaceae bacterium]